jgi:hypothetical protein
MSISDFISKTASDALGRIIAQAPDSFMTMFTSAAIVTVEISITCHSAVSALLTKTGTPLYRPVSKYTAEFADVAKFTLTGQDNIKVTADRNWECYLVKQRPIIIKTVVIDKVPRFFLTTIRGFDIEGLIKTAAREWPARKQHYVYTYTMSSKDDTMKSESNFQAAIPPYWRSPAVNLILTEIHNWKLSYAKCKERGLPWRRGWLLHGSPGNGKTQAVKLAAAVEKIGLACINLNMSDAQLVAVFKELVTPCIVLIEDIDDIIRGRQNIKDPTKGVSFSTLLNCIDGVNSRDGVVVAVTTNDLAAIDPALGRPRDEAHWNQLSTRPGRLDRCIRFDNPDLEGRIAIGKMLLNEAEAVTLAHAHEDVSLVQFQAICREAAFAKLQDLEAI